jgi:hypothetical protein
MAGKKRQHYIPRLYLRNFIKSGDGLHRYTIQTKDYNRKNLENICMNFNFYSDPPHAESFENSLSKMENNIGPILKDVLGKKQLPAKNSNNMKHLMTFVLFLESRTAASKKIAEEIWSAITPDFTVYLKKANYYTMISALFAPLLIDDLACVLIKNDSGISFITSDAPVIRYNYFDHNNRVAGLQCPGLIIFLPLSIDICLCLYDSVQYGMDINPGDGLVHIAANQDIEEINKLQVINAESYLFTSEEVVSFNQFVISVYPNKINMINPVAIRQTLVNDFQAVRLTAYQFALFEWRIIHYRAKLPFVTQICNNANVIFSKIVDPQSQNIYREPAAFQVYKSVSDAFLKHDNSRLGKILTKIRLRFLRLKIRFGFFGH